MDDEDVARMAALADTMAQTVTEAFINRFKTPTKENMMIILSSLNKAMLFFLDHIAEEDRKRMIEAIHCSMKGMVWTDDGWPMG